MDHTTTEIRTEQWRQIVLEANGTSLTKKEFCRQNGIKEKQFYYWQRKIRRQDATRLLSEAALPPVQSAPIVSPCSSSFVALDLLESEESPPTRSSLLQERSILNPEVMIPINGYHLFVGAGIQETTLHTVIKVLRNA